MTYTHITMDELVMIEAYYHQGIPVAKIAAYLNRTRTPINNVIRFFRAGHTEQDIQLSSITYGIRKTRNSVDAKKLFYQKNNSFISRKK
jgi:IS30 family transposase